MSGSKRSICAANRSDRVADNSIGAALASSIRFVIISVHIPKCGGISFEHVLQGIYGKKRVWLSYRPISGPPELRYNPIPPGMRCIHGHFPSDTFDRFVPGPELVTWLRHPVERVVSNYHHFFRHPDPANPCCRELLEKGLSLEEFAELDLLRNEATRYMAGKPVGAFKFIGIMERFQESLKIFGETFRVRVPRKAPCENRNASRSNETYSIPARTYEHILALNQNDLMTYELVAARLDRQVAESLAFSAAGDRSGAKAGWSSVLSFSR